MYKTINSNLLIPFYPTKCNLYNINIICVCEMSCNYNLHNTIFCIILLPTWFDINHSKNSNAFDHLICSYAVICSYTIIDIVHVCVLDLCCCAFVSVCSLCNIANHWIDGINSDICSGQRVRARTNTNSYGPHTIIIKVSRMPLI